MADTKKKKFSKKKIKLVARIATTGAVGNKKPSLADTALNRGSAKTVSNAKKIVELARNKNKKSKAAKKSGYSAKNRRTIY